MKIAAVLFVLLIGVGAGAFFLLFPKGVFISVTGSGKQEYTLSRSGISVTPPPEHFETKGFDQIETYVTRLLNSDSDYRAIIFSTSDGDRAFLIYTRGSATSASLDVDWREHPEKEAAIRAFFAKLNIAPSQDYLAGNGGINDSTRMLEYPLEGNASQIAALTKRIMSELCDIRPDEALDISFRDK